MSEPPASKKAKTLSPYDQYFEEQKAFMKAESLVKAMMIQGIEKKASASAPDDDDEDDDDDDEKEDDDDDEPDTSTYTSEQMAQMRFIMLTKEREIALKRYRTKLLGQEQPIMMFDTSFSYVVFDEHFCLDADYKKQKDLKEKFNMLFAFTHTIHTYDVWLHDNEDEEGMEDMVHGLAKCWKKLLTKTDEELGIDTEYTRPGIISLLQKFKKMVEAAEAIEQFNFQ